MKILIQLMISVGIASHCSGSILYSNDFDDASSLDGFTIGQIGSGRVALDGGKLRIDPGPGYLNRGFAALNVSGIPDYNAVLASNPGILIWAFNVSNSDGAFDRNNVFRFGISSSPDAHDSAGLGYHLGAGGYVGDRMIL